MYTFYNYKFIFRIINSTVKSKRRISPAFDDIGRNMSMRDIRVVFFFANIRTTHEKRKQLVYIYLPEHKYSCRIAFSLVHKQADTHTSLRRIGVFFLSDDEKHIGLPIRQRIDPPYLSNQQRRGKRSEPSPTITRENSNGDISASLEPIFVIVSFH